MVRCYSYHSLHDNLSTPPPPSSTDLRFAVNLASVFPLSDGRTLRRVIAYPVDMTLYLQDLQSPIAAGHVIAEPLENDRT